LRDFHVGEIAGEYNALDRSITVHHLVDLGPNDRTSSWKKNKPLDQRRVYHEYRDNNGVSTTLNRRTRPARKGELPLQGDYEAHKITIIVKNFVMQSGGKIPRDVLFARALKNGLQLKNNRNLRLISAQMVILIELHFRVRC
tara:strand:- start:9 stop:434 length:426 start_codon:yes stop_codon:yes gene_type:complete